MQGNEFEQFYTESLTVLRDCVKKMIEDGHFLKSRVLVSRDSEDTFVKWVDPVEKPNPTALTAIDEALNKSFEHTLLDSIIVEQIDKISDGKIPESIDVSHHDDPFP